MVFKIEKNVALPAQRAPRTQGYPFAQMRVGDSFSLPIEAKARVSVNATNFCKRHVGFKFTVRRQPDGSYRCWRISVGSSGVVRRKK